MYETLLVQDKGYVSVIAINRAEKLNSLGEEVRRDLLNAFRDFNRDDGKRVAIITGEGRAFSAGADVSSSSGTGAGVNIEHELSDSFHLILKEIRYSKKIFISAINGVAAGAGISLALACDRSFASSASKFVMAFQGIGLAPDTGLTLILSRLAGARALPYLLHGGEFSAYEAESMGLVKVVDNPVSEALKMADNLANGPFAAYSVGKQLITKSIYHDLDDFLKEEAELQGKLSESHDFKEGV
ncbi:MAG: enoyl-CoA hydratase-related protein, partial [Thermoplasmataceae archaeon]